MLPAALAARAPRAGRDRAGGARARRGRRRDVYVAALVPDRSHQLDSRLAPACVRQPGFAGSGPGQPPVYIQLRAANGTTILAQQSSPTFDADGERSPPRLPATISLLGAVQRGPDLVRFFDVPTSRATTGATCACRRAGEGGDTRRRDLAERCRRHAASARGRRGRGDRNRLSAALTLLALWLVATHSGLCAAIERTAGAIADGDLAQRVERATTGPRSAGSESRSTRCSADRDGVPRAGGVGAGAAPLRRRRIA